MVAYLSSTKGDDLASAARAHLRGARWRAARDRPRQPEGRRRARRLRHRRRPLLHHYPRARALRFRVSRHDRGRPGTGQGQSAVECIRRSFLRRWIGRRTDERRCRYADRSCRDDGARPARSLRRERAATSCRFRARASSSCCGRGETASRQPRADRRGLLLSAWPHLHQELWAKTSAHEVVLFHEDRRVAASARRPWALDGAEHLPTIASICGSAAAPLGGPRTSIGPDTRELSRVFDDDV